MNKYFLVAVVLFISIELKAQGDFIKVNSTHYINFNCSLVLAIKGDKYTIMDFDRNSECNLLKNNFKPDNEVRKVITEYIAKHKNWIRVEPTSYTNGSEVNINGSEVYINLDFVEDIHKTKDGNSWVLTLSVANTPFSLKVANEKGLLDYLGASHE